MSINIFTSFLLPSMYVLFIFFSLLFLSKEKRSLRELYTILLLIFLMAPSLQKDLIDFLKPIRANYFFLREAVPLIICPLLYLYTQALIHSTQKTKWFGLFHAIPFLIVCILLVFPILPSMLAPLANQNHADRNINTNSRPLFLLIVSAFGTMFFIYYGLNIFKLLKHRKEALEEYFSFISSDLKLFWIKELLFGLALVQLYILSSTIASLFGIRSPLLNPSDALNYGYCLFFFFFAFYGIKQDKVVFKYGEVNDKLSEKDQLSLKQNIIELKSEDSILEKESPIITDTSNEIKYKKSGLENAHLEHIYEKISNLMNTEKLYLKSDLTLEHLSIRTGISRHYISQALNQMGGKNFYTWINHFRTKDLINNLSAPELDTVTVLELAGRCGFNSKSSFIHYFKEATGLSPSEFRKNRSK